MTTDMWNDYVEVELRTVQMKNLRMVVVCAWRNIVEEIKTHERFQKKNNNKYS